MTEVNQRYHDALKEMCGDNIYAHRWLQQVRGAALLWDHVVDKEDIDVDSANDVMIGLLTEWGINPFFIKYSLQLIPVMVACISSWKFSNEDKSPKVLAYSIYTEVPCVVAYLLGGQERVDKHMPEIRKLVLEMLDEDEARDDGKK